MRVVDTGMILGGHVIESKSEGEVNVSGQPMWWSRDSGKDFVVVGGSKTKISIDVMGGRGSNHAATFFCLDRVITF